MNEERWLPSEEGQEARPPEVGGEKTRTASGGADRPERQMLAFTASAFSGPLPPPEILAAYENALPSSAERILKMTEEQGSHRRQMERDELDANRRSQTRGQYLAFTLALVVSAGGIYLLATGHSVAGLVALLTPLAGLAGVFLITRSRDDKRTGSGVEALKRLLQDRQPTGDGSADSPPSDGH